MAKPHKLAYAATKARSPPGKKSKVNITCLAARNDGTYCAGAENGKRINIAITSSLQQAIMVPD